MNRWAFQRQQAEQQSRLSTAFLVGADRGLGALGSPPIKPQAAAVPFDWYDERLYWLAGMIGVVALAMIGAT